MKPGRISFSMLTLTLIAVVTGCLSRPLLYDVTVSPITISPNADGDMDVTYIGYKLSRPADLSIYFVDEKGERHYFRKDRRRSPGKYGVYFGGVVEGRVLPDGDYTYVVEANGLEGHTERAEGSLTLVDADTTPAELLNFTVYPQAFTPNQDGIEDRVAINYYLTEKAEVRVYLIGEDGEKYPIAEKEREIEPGEPGTHIYDYDGGVDLGAQPPPDGTYTVRAEAEDRAGNRTVITSILTIEDGGVPKADIIPWGPLNRRVEFEPKIVPLGETLHFTATVENYGMVPIRTSGPPPGTTYRSDQNFNTLGWYEEPGVWRFGIDFETNSSGRPYPYRWAIGSDEDLEIRIIEGREYRYLMPGQRAVITGSIRIVDEPPRNPIHFWAGLIHEDVRIDPYNDHVDPQEISIGF